jgi:hypothetical protein
MTEQIDIPSWVKGRQANVEPIGQGLYRVTGPNLPEAIVGVRMTTARRSRSALRPRRTPGMHCSPPLSYTANT